MPDDGRSCPLSRLSADRLNTAAALPEWSAHERLHASSAPLNRKSRPHEVLEEVRMTSTPKTSKIAVVIATPAVMTPRRRSFRPSRLMSSTDSNFKSALRSFLSDFGSMPSERQPAVVMRSSMACSVPEDPTASVQWLCLKLRRICEISRLA